VRAITVVPLQKGSLDLTDMPEPPHEGGPVLVETLAQSQDAYARQPDDVKTTLDFTR
jgi:hypothetical protein